jgi:hypothetical protein
MLNHRGERAGSPSGPSGQGKKKPPYSERRPGGEFSGNSTHNDSLSNIFFKLPSLFPKFKIIFRQFASGRVDRGVIQTYL